MLIIYNKQLNYYTTITIRVEIYIKTFMGGMVQCDEI